MTPIPLHSPLLEPDTFNYDTHSFGKHWANDYDIVEPFDNPDISKAVSILKNLANKQPALEVAVGTGRVAIPLAAAGVSVTGSDSSQDMLDALRAHDVHSQVTIYQDIMPAITDKSFYGLIYSLVNSMWYMTTPEEQQKFLKNVVKRLRPNGKLLIEMQVADPRNWVGEKTFEFPGTTVIRTSKYSPVSQKLLQRFDMRKNESNKVDLRDDLVRVIFPNELLLMCEIAGLKPVAIWSDWDETEFSHTSKNMIAIFESKKLIS